MQYCSIECFTLRGYNSNCLRLGLTECGQRALQHVQFHMWVRTMRFSGTSDVMSFQYSSWFESLYPAACWVDTLLWAWELKLKILINLIPMIFYYFWVKCSVQFMCVHVSAWVCALACACMRVHAWVCLAFAIISYANLLWSVSVHHAALESFIINSILGGIFLQVRQMSTSTSVVQVV